MLVVGVGNGVMGAGGKGGLCGGGLGGKWWWWWDVVES